MPFAVLRSAKYLREYIEWGLFVLRTNHTYLKFIPENGNPLPKIDICATAFMSYDYYVFRYIRSDENSTNFIGYLI